MPMPHARKDLQPRQMPTMFLMLPTDVAMLLYRDVIAVQPLFWDMWIMGSLMKVICQNRYRFFCICMLLMASRQ